MVLKLCAVLLLSMSRLGYADQIWVPADASHLSDLELQMKVADHDLVVVGEDHYDPATVTVEARIATLMGQTAKTSLGWEFLNTIDSALIQRIEERVKSGAIDASGALTELFPDSAPPLEYSALIQATMRPSLDLFATNLTRAQKQPVTQGGMEAADPALVPPGFALGSDSYFVRFKEAMGDHPLPWPVENYFASQSLTDDVMAYSLLATPGPKKVLIAGSFHGDYRQGVVARVAARAPHQPVLYIKIINADYYTSEEIDALKVGHLYGPVADILYIVQPPARNPSH